MNFVLIPDDEYDHLIANAKRRFPEVVFNEEFVDIPYVAIGDFVRHLCAQYLSGNRGFLDAAFKYIEELHKSKSGKVRELATIGILEGLQNILSDQGIKEIEFEKSLGPESAKWWRQLNKFWNKEIRFVGESIDLE